MENPFVSIIVINYNGIRHLKECFASLNNLTYKNCEIIFVDNNSNDKSVEFVRNNYQNVKIIQLNTNKGFTGANNIGVINAKGDYLILLNNDTYVDKYWVTELIKLASLSHKIGIVGSKIYYYNNKELISYAGGSCDKFGKANHIAENKKDNKFINVPRKTFYVCGAAMMIKRELYEKIGLFDPLYFIYSEDLDLCWRAWLFGYEVIFAPESFVYHKIGQVLDPFSMKKRFLGEKNLLRTILKNYELKSLLKVIPIYIGKRIGMIINFLLHFDKLAIAMVYIYLKSVLWNIVNIKSLIKNRSFIQKFRTRNDKYILKLMDNTVRLDLSLRKIN